MRESVIRGAGLVSAHAAMRRRVNRAKETLNLLSYSGRIAQVWAGRCPWSLETHRWSIERHKKPFCTADAQIGAVATGAASVNGGRLPSAPTPGRGLPRGSPHVVPHLAASRAAPIAVGVGNLRGCHNRRRAAGRTRPGAGPFECRGRHTLISTRVAVFHVPSGDVLWRAGAEQGSGLRKAGRGISIQATVVVSGGHR